MIYTEHKTRFLATVLLLGAAALARAAGGVVGEPGSCMIKIGFYEAHFKIGRAHV